MAPLEVIAAVIIVYTPTACHHFFISLKNAVPHEYCWTAHYHL